MYKEVKTNYIVRDRTTWLEVRTYVHTMDIQWNLSSTTTCGPALTDLYRAVIALQR